MVKKINPTQYEQLTLLDMDDAEENMVITPEVARKRSEAARTALEVKLKKDYMINPDTAIPSWYEDYAEMTRRNIPWRVAVYIAWAASPITHRWPKTQDELARNVLGLTSDRVIATWRKKNPMIDEMVHVMAAQSLFKYRAAAFDALAQSASDPDYRHNPDRRLFFMMTNDYKDELTIHDKSGSVEDMPDDVLRELAANHLTAAVDTSEGKGDDAETE